MSHFQTKDEGSRDADLAITACFLSIPLVSLLYALLSFSIALGAFCIQNTETHGRILLAVVLGILGTAGFSTLLFFWHVWRGPRTEEVEDEDVMDVLGYGWRTKAQKVAEKTKDVVRGQLRAIAATRQRFVKKGKQVAQDV